MDFANRLYKKRKIVLYCILGAVAACCGVAVFDDTSTWLNRAGLLADIAGLLQLEVSGVFEALHKMAVDLDEQGENIPSHLVREIIDTPEEDKTLKDRVDEWLTRSPKTGVLLIGIGCGLQLLGTFF